MRKILFRGKRRDNGEWIYGNLLDDGMTKKSFFILPSNADNYDEYEGVFTETLGQFTGLYDKNGREIYEGDTDDRGYVVTWNNDLACFFLGDAPLSYSNSHREFK